MSSELTAKDLAGEPKLIRHHHHHHHSHEEPNPGERKSEYRNSVQKLRLLLMFFLCIDLFGLPTIYGSFAQAACRFAPLSFFILSGYFVLRDSENRSERILRTIKRSAIVFAILVPVYLAVNFAYYTLNGMDFFAPFLSGQAWLDFLLFNLWPFDIGNAIWYVQAYLYAYIILYFLEKKDLLRYDWLIAGACIVLAVLTGELTGVLKFNVFGYEYFPGNFLTRALPYLLIGSLMRRKFKLLNRVPMQWYAVFCLIGTALVVAEIFALSIADAVGYYGHLVGMGVLAVSACMIALKDDREATKFEKKFRLSRRDTAVIYYCSQPVAYGLAILLKISLPQYFDDLAGVIGLATFVVCFVIMLPVAFIRRKHRTKKYLKAHNARLEKEKAKAEGAQGPA